MSTVHLEDVRVTRDGTEILHGIDLHVHDRERLAVLGPSGSGKSTLLRAVAGLDDVSAGQVVLDDRDVTGLATREREVSMVSQAGGLMRHLDVEGNLGFPLSIRRVGQDEKRRRVDAEARAFSLSGILRRKPRTLSAGEQQEVSLARSLVRRGGVLLLDEPFSKADAPRRADLVRELIRIQEGYGVTLLIATNDQRVAMSVAQRCAVLHRGRIAQLGPPTQLYATPATTFVATFLGSPPMNLVPGRIERVAGRARLQAGPLTVPALGPRLSRLIDSACTVGIRPGDLERASPAALVTIEEVVTRTAFLGSEVEVALSLGAGSDAELVAVLDRPAPRVGELLRLMVAPEDIHVFAPDGQALSHGV